MSVHIYSEINELEIGVVSGRFRSVCDMFCCGIGKNSPELLSFRRQDNMNNLSDSNVISDVSKTKCVLVLFLSFIALAFLFFSLVCLKGVSNTFEKYSVEETVTIKSLPPLQSQLTLSSLSLEFSKSSLFVVSTSNGDSEKDLVSEKEGKDLANEKENESLVSEEEEDEANEEEGEGSTSKNVTSVMFLWHFTSAAVCFTIFIVIFASVISIKVIRHSRIMTIFDCGNERSFYFQLCLLLLFAILLPVLPALRMDGFLKASYWIFFIPSLLLAVLMPVLFIYSCYSFIKERKEIGRDKACYPILLIFSILVFAFYFLSLSGLILFILRLEGVLPLSFRYPFIFLFFGLGFSCGIDAVCYVAVYPGLSDRQGIDEDELDTAEIAPCIGIAVFLTMLVLYGGFFFPFTLRKEQVFHTSYHFTFIPYFVLSVAFPVGITLVCYIDFCQYMFDVYVPIEETRSKIFLILIYVAFVFLVLSFVCLGGANDAYEKYPDGKIVTIMNSSTISSLQSELTLSSLSLGSSESSLLELYPPLTERGREDMVSEKKKGNVN